MTIYQSSQAQPLRAQRDRPIAEIYGELPSDLHLQIIDVFIKTATIYPEREAVVSLWQLADPAPSERSSKPQPVRLTYRELLQKANILVQSLRRLGRRSGMRLGAVLWNSTEWALLLWTAAQLGMTFVPIDPRVEDEARGVILASSLDIIVVQGEQEAAIVEALSDRLSTSIVRVQCSAPERKGWLSLSQLCSPSSRSEKIQHSAAERFENHNPALIVFTSGTTGAPRGCLHTNSGLIAQTADFDPNVEGNVVDRWLVHTPVSHIFAINNALRAWRYGGTVVFASRSFDVDATMQALVQEQCSIMSATPTLVKSIMAHPRFPDKAQLNIRLISLAGTDIRQGDIDLCLTGLGAKHAIQAFGMSEGAPLISWSRTDKQLVNGFHPGAGKVLPGAAVRICAPGTQQVLGIDEIGELHVSGSSVIGGYLNNADADLFYQCASGRWLMTGDQAVICGGGIVHILGRYKDIIIRGGENIYPAKIESMLQKALGVQVHVVGVHDDVAGEIPVAVARLPEQVTKSQVFETASSLGPRYVLGALYTVDELKLECVPVTSLGKVKRQKLKTIVEQYRSTQHDKSTLNESNTRHLSGTLMAIWEDLTGARPSATAEIALVADSITLLRYCDAVFRSSGRKLYLQDVMKNATVEKQAQLLSGREASDASPSSMLSAESSLTSSHQSSDDFNGDRDQLANNPTSNQMHLASDLQKAANASLLQLSLGSPIGSNMIEDILPIRSTLHRMVLGQRPQAYRSRLIFRVSASSQRVRCAIEKLLATRPMLRTVSFSDTSGNPHHAVLKADHDLFCSLISQRTVLSDHEAEKVCKEDGPASHVSPNMFKALIIEGGTGGVTFLSLTYDHSIMDALTLLSWHQELDRLIADESTRSIPLTPYKMFSGLYENYQGSLIAQESVRFQVRRLRGIARLRQGLWPMKRAPGWMISNDEASRHADVRDQIRKARWNGDWQRQAETFRFPRIGRVVNLPQLAKLRKVKIEPAMFTKGALIIFNVLRTGCGFAIFNTWVSGRLWPFVTDWMERLLPPAMSIDGPTVEWVLDIFEVHRDETVMEFLQRTSAEGDEAARHQHVPWQKVVAELGEEGEIAVDASYRQSFVWDVSLGLNASKGFRGDLKCLEPIARLDWADCGLFWNAFMLSEDDLNFVASWDTAQMNAVEMQECCDELEDVMRKLAKEENWGCNLSDVFDNLN